jgi:hypothetical protein
MTTMQRLVKELDLVVHDRTRHPRHGSGDLHDGDVRKSDVNWLLSSLPGYRRFSIRVPVVALRLPPSNS